MAALVEGHNYGLSSENSTSVQKSIIHCKLTDSALKALEEFQRIKDATGRKPTIQFQGQNGVIKVPMLQSTDSPDGLRTFTFSLSPVTVDPKGSFECVRQDDARREQELDLLGAMLHKVSVQGTDDSYRTARERMTKAEEDSKKQRAKEIKPGAGMRIKKVVRKPFPAPNASISAPQKPSVNTFKAIAPPSRSVGQREDLSAPVAHPAHLSSHSQRSAAPSHINKPHPNLTKPSGSSTLSSNQSKPSPTQSNFSKPALSSNHNAIINMPFRDRIIHLLAIRPYKKVEILMRLQKDGIKEKDKTALSSVLVQVGTFNPREKNYSLAKHIYADVRTEWPHYTEVDRQILKRKMNQLQEPSLTASTSPAVSPCHSTGSQGSPNNSQKRVIEEEEKATDHPQKKQRIAHGNHGNKSDCNPKSVVPGNKSSIISSPNLVSPESPSNQENNNLLDTGHVVKPDYTRKYGTIACKDQRQRYKSEFNAEYDEYRGLHAKIEQITKRFIDLKDQLNRQPKETENYKNVRKLIMSEYKTVKGDSKYLEQRKRHDYLHHKLGHIKKLITEFDQSRLAVS